MASRSSTVPLEIHIGIWKPLTSDKVWDVVMVMRSNTLRTQAILRPRPGIPSRLNIRKTISWEKIQLDEHLRNLKRSEIEDYCKSKMSNIGQQSDPSERGTRLQDDGHDLHVIISTNLSTNLSIELTNEQELRKVYLRIVAQRATEAAAAAAAVDGGATSAAARGSDPKIQSSAVSETKTLEGVTYSRSSNGLFPGMLVSKGTAHINGEEYEEYRILGKPI